MGLHPNAHYFYVFSARRDELLPIPNAVRDRASRNTLPVQNGDDLLRVGIWRTLFPIESSPRSFGYIKEDALRHASQMGDDIEHASVSAD